MKLTSEQQAIVSSSGNLKIQAVAGSGKTSTLLMYAKERAANKRVLYIAFNRSVRLEAQNRFTESGCRNVHVETAHSLAFKNVVSKYGYQVRNDYKPNEIIEHAGSMVKLRDSALSLIIGNHISRYCNFFCNSSAQKVADLDYASQIHDAAALKFVKSHYDRIVDGTRRFLAKMNSGELPVTHSFYLKKFQLAAPKLPYDLILFDEGQDASPVMLDIFLNQEQATKIIVGDIHQQIYSWRYAVNALQDISFDSMSLSTSFRFPQAIADLAMKALAWKAHLGNYEPLAITGAGKVTKTKLKATLARTNLSLLRSAIHFIDSKNRRVYFEGNLSSYTYAAEGASIWDVLALYSDQKDRIRDPLVKSMSSFEDLEEYAELTDDKELTTLIEMVDEYGKQLPRHISRLKELHVPDAQRERAEMIFSTVHRCKGLEYDSVILEDDFIGEQKLKKLSQREQGKNDQDTVRLNEEINLVYVALTRTRNRVTCPDSMFEKVEKASKKISSTRTNSSKFPPKGAYTGYQKKKPSKTSAPWSSHEDQRLRLLVNQGKTAREISSALDRNSIEISSRLKKLDNYA